MTKAQKENQLRFKQAQAIAKDLKLKNKNLKHTDAVKKAFEMMQKIVKKVAVKKVAVKKVAVKKLTPVKNKVIAGRLNLTGKETRLGYMPKKSSVKKIAGYLPEYKYFYSDITENEKKLKLRLNRLDSLQNALKKNENKMYFKDIKQEILCIKKYISEIKTHLKEINKIILQKK